MPTSPKLLHRVWLGPNPQPSEYDYTEAWERTNPGWLLQTWTDRNVAQLFPLANQRLYNDAPTVVHRKDLIVVEAVYQLGGVAVDYDMEPLRPLDPFIDGHDCWCTPDADGFAGGAFFGAVPHHRAIRHLLETFQRRIGRDGWAKGWPQPHVDTGPWAWGEAFGRHGEHCVDYGMDILGDVRTAYPIGYGEKHLFDDPVEYAHRTEHSMVVHRFAGSWLSTDVKVR